MQQWAGRVRSGKVWTAETKPSNSLMHLLNRNRHPQFFLTIIYSLHVLTIIKPLQWLWTIGLQYSEHGRHRWLSMLDGQSDSCFDFGYCITQVRIIVSVCSNPLPPFLWTLLKRSQTLTLYFDRAKGRFYYLSRGWQVVTRLAYRPVEKVYGPLYRNVSACTWPCS